MVATSQSEALTAPPARQAFSRRFSPMVRRLRESEMNWLLPLVLLTVVLGIGLLTFTDLPVTAVVIPLVLSNLVLRPSTLPWFVVFTLGVLVVGVAATAETSLDGRRVGGIVIAFLVGLIILTASFRRSPLGVSGGMGESMLIDLRDRISKQGRIPALPKAWYAESVMRSAGASSFAGDFMVASRSEDERLLQVVIVDVSGKGEQAGTRALLLSGAFGGLLGALPPAAFLAAANTYLLRQDWSEGFASAVHLSLDLQTGDFELRSAGHPPGVQLQAGSGRWAIHEADGPVLGLIANAEFPRIRGTMQSGDALLLYTDGLVETPERDISLGIDKLLGEGELLLRAGIEQGAYRLIDKLESTNDDRALVMLHRR
jgi:Stage II sporulation protein E (SpoIIE)